MQKNTYIDGTLRRLIASRKGFVDLGRAAEVDGTVTVSTQEIMLAGTLVGLDRGMRGRTAGLRTNILVCLAAAGAMIEANLTLGVLGRTGSSFTMMVPCASRSAS